MTLPLIVLELEASECMLVLVSLFSVKQTVRPSPSDVQYPFRSRYEALFTKGSNPQPLLKCRIINCTETIIQFILKYHSSNIHAVVAVQY